MVVTDYVLRTLGGGDAAHKEELLELYPELRRWAAQIDERVAMWHRLGLAGLFTRVSLAEYLGLTEAAYAKWVEGRRDMMALKDLKPAGPLQTQVSRVPSVVGLEGLSVRAANCLRRMKPSLDTRAAVLAAMLVGKLHPEKVTCLNLGWAMYREVRSWLGKELIVGEIMRDTKMAPQERLWLLPVGVSRREAAAVQRFLARLSAGDPPDANSLKSLLLGIAHAWEVRGA